MKKAATAAFLIVFRQPEQRQESTQRTPQRIPFLNGGMQRRIVVKRRKPKQDEAGMVERDEHQQDQGSHLDLLHQIHPLSSYESWGLL